MTISAPYEGTATIGTTEFSCPNNSTSLASITTDGIYQVWLDLNNLAAGDDFTLQIKEKILSSGTQRVVYDARFNGAQSSVFVAPALELLHGWDVTLRKNAGTDRPIDWSIRAVT